MGLPFATLLLVAAGLLHVWLQLYNRWLLLIRDSRHKDAIHHASFLLVVVAPLVVLLALRDGEAARQALAWRPESAPARLLFGGFATLWVFALARLGFWFSDRLLPRRTRRVLSDHVRVPRLAKPRSRLPFFLRRMETTYDLHVRRIELEVPALASEFDGLSIALASDIHFDPRDGRRPWFDSVADLVNGLHADVVVFTGDFVNRPSAIRESAAFHARMKGRLATLCVLGNHDYWTDPALIRRECLRHGIRPMHNKRWTIERAGRRLTFAGTDAPWEGRSTRWNRLLRPAPGECVVLLSHTPDNTPHAARAGASLILSGHNHGGQTCFPLVGAVVVPSRHGHRFVEGVIDVGSDTVLVVSRGVGTSMHRRGGRTLCPPEIILLTLKAPAIEIAVPLRAERREEVRAAVPAAG